MDYDNQLAQTGQLVTSARHDHQHQGFLPYGRRADSRLGTIVMVVCKGNAALSKNKIKDFDEYAKQLG